MPDDFGLLTDADLERLLDERLSQRRGLDAPAFPRLGVYFLRCGPFVKIGIANCVRARLAGLDRVVPYPLVALGWIPCDSRTDAARLEQRLHQQFSALRTKGEWFQADASLLAHIDATAAAWPAPETGPQ